MTRYNYFFKKLKNNFSAISVIYKMPKEIPKLQTPNTKQILMTNHSNSKQGKNRNGVFILFRISNFSSTRKSLESYHHVDIAFPFSNIACY